MTVAIRETTVTPSGAGCVVTIRCDDAPPQGASPGFALTLVATLETDASQRLAAIQNAALRVLREELTALLQETQTASARGDSRH
jgi:hypothetical protein